MLIANRRAAIGALAGGLAGLAARSSAWSQQAPAQSPPKPLPLALDLIQRFIRAAHADIDLTRQMLDEEPRLIKAAWDWGGGDFETALGGAGHMGRRDIAGLLLERGAPLELCAAAMLGELSIVRAALETRPSLVRVPGPHGIALLAHARAGGAAAAPVVDYINVVLKTV